MNLTSLITKGGLRQIATATPATSASYEPFSPTTTAQANTPSEVTNGTTPDSDRWCWPHSSAMDTAEIETFTVRLARFTDWGVILEDAERIADQLVIRDREQDDRVICLECTYLHRGGRCSNWQQAGMAFRARDAVIPVELVRKLQRCDGFLGYRG